MTGEVDDEEGGFDWSVDEDVVFLDEDGQDELDEALGDAGWLAEERLYGGRDLGRSLPPSAPHSRVLASLLALAVFLGCTGAAFTDAYHRHVTDRRIANTLDLAPSVASPAIPGLAALNVQTLWHAEIEERVVIPVVNQSPGPVVLLGAVLEEPGMIAAASLQPVGAARLAPGRTGTVQGEITVDCTQDPAAVFPFIDNSDNSTVPLPNTAELLVRARTESGHVGEAALDPDADGPDLQVRICQQEGFDIAATPTVFAIGYPRTHTVEVTLVMASTADITMGYRASATYARSDNAEYGISGVADASPPEPLLPATGTVRSGGTIHISFVIHVTCPINAQPTDEVFVEVMLTAGGNPVDAIEEAAGLAPPLDEACGEG
jgi:hypothetical protein